jgi:tRNA (cytidine32/guanosine34-2'-O)-methyltransferase
MGKSSKDKRDAYYRLAKEQGWRARSAFKLMQLDEQYNLLRDVTHVVDLCAAPGSWSQVLSRTLIGGERLGHRAWEDLRAKLAARMRGISDGFPGTDDEEEEDTDDGEYIYEDKEEDEYDGEDWYDHYMGNEIKKKKTKVEKPNDEETEKKTDDGEKNDAPKPDIRIVAIDLQPMSPLPGVTMLQADITHPSTIPLLLSALGVDDPNAVPQPRPVDLVLCDGAPDVTGLHDLDAYVQSTLVAAAQALAVKVLRPGGAFVAKIFRTGASVTLCTMQARVFFREVTVAKPRSSRASSLEAFLVCRDFVPLDSAGGNLIEGWGGKPRPAGVPDDGRPYRPGGDAAWIAPFLACGSLAGWDADASSPLPSGDGAGGAAASLDPVQPPTAPPYARALAARRAAGGAHGKTGKPPVAGASAAAGGEEDGRGLGLDERMASATLDETACPPAGASGVTDGEKDSDKHGFDSLAAPATLAKPKVGTSAITGRDKDGNELTGDDLVASLDPVFREWRASLPEDWVPPDLVDVLFPQRVPSPR